MPDREMFPVAAARSRANRTEGGRFARSTSPSTVKLTVRSRPQTELEGRQFKAALDLLLSEIVRQELSLRRK